MFEYSNFPTVEQFLEMSDVELGQQEIAAVHLACAVGLPGSDGLHIAACFERLDEWTERVHSGIGRAMVNRPQIPEYDELSESEYKILTMFAVLYRHLGMTVTVDFNEDFDGSDSRNLFIHAILMDGYPAICSTAPVIFASIGRRLDFPIKLVKSRNHIFCRWDDGSERFNIETTDRGYYRNSDEHYLEWPRPTHKDAVERGIFMQNLSSREEFALFLAQRGQCFTDNLRPGEALAALHHACRLDPHDYFHRYSWKLATLMYRGKKEARQSRLDDMPPADLWLPAPKQAWERDIYPSARENLDRIFAIRRKKMADALN